MGLGLFCRKFLFPIKLYAIYFCLLGFGCTLRVWRSHHLEGPSVSSGAACWQAGGVAGAREEGLSSHMLLFPMPPCCLGTLKGKKNPTKQKNPPLTLGSCSGVRLIISPCRWRGWEERLVFSLHGKPSLGHGTDLAGKAIFFQQLRGLLLAQETMLVGTWEHLASEGLFLIRPF